MYHRWWISELWWSQWLASCPHLPVCPPLPGPHTVDGEVTGDQWAPGGLLGYGVGHGWGHHPAAGLWQRRHPYPCHQVRGGPHRHPFAPHGWLGGAPTPGARHQPGPHPSWPPLHPVQWVPRQLVPLVCHCTGSLLLLSPFPPFFVVFHFWNQFDTVLKSPDATFKSVLPLPHVSLGKLLLSEPYLPSVKWNGSSALPGW